MAACGGTTAGRPGRRPQLHAPVVTSLAMVLACSSPEAPRPRLRPGRIASERDSLRDLAALVVRVRPVPANVGSPPRAVQVSSLFGGSGRGAVLDSTGAAAFTALAPVAFRLSLWKLPRPTDVWWYVVQLRPGHVDTLDFELGASCGRLGSD